MILCGSDYPISLTLLIAKVVIMLEYDEKRKYMRMDTHCKMTYKFPQAKQSHDATCLNLSGAGILFRAQESLEPGRALEICLTPETNVTPPMTAYIEIVRSSSCGSDQYEIAASIKGIKAE